MPGGNLDRDEGSGGGPARPSACGGGVRKTVLLIDPDLDSRLVYGSILRHHGYGVLEAGSGAEGVALACKYRPDVVVTELFVPSVRGWEVPDVLQEDPRTRDIPVVAVSAHARPEDEGRARASGCAAFLTKPCAPNEVLGEVRRLIGGPSRGH